MNKLLKLYLSILDSWNCVVKDSDKIFLKINNIEEAVKLDDMSVYLPTNNVLNSDTGNKVFFHPGCESYLSKETEIFRQVIRPIIAMRFIMCFKELLAGLDIAAKTKNKKKLHNNLIALLEPFESLTKSEMKTLSNLLGKMSVHKKDGIDTRFIYFNITKDGKNEDNNKIYHKTKPIFPFYNELAKQLHRNEELSNNKTIEVFDMEISIKVLKTVVHLFENTLVGVKNTTLYECESLSPHASRFTSLIGTFIKIAEDINRVQNLFRDVFDKLSIYPIDLTWTDNFENIDELYKMVPYCRYNDNSNKEETDNATESIFISSGNQQSVTTKPVNQQQQTIINYSGVNYNITRPDGSTGPGEVYVGYDIDSVNKQVLHTYNTPMGSTKTYYCSDLGNLITVKDNSYINSGFGNLGGFNNFNTGFGGMTPNINMLQLQQFLSSKGYKLTEYNGILYVQDAYGKMKTLQEFQQMMGGSNQYVEAQKFNNTYSGYGGFNGDNSNETDQLF